MNVTILKFKKLLTKISETSYFIWHFHPTLYFLFICHSSAATFAAVTKMRNICIGKCFCCFFFYFGKMKYLHCNFTNVKAVATVVHFSPRMFNFKESLKMTAVGDAVPTAFRFCVNIWNIFCLHIFEEMKSFVSAGNLLDLYFDIIVFRNTGHESFDVGIEKSRGFPGNICCQI